MGMTSQLYEQGNELQRPAALGIVTELIPAGTKNDGVGRRGNGG